jgi:pimeloyl-ACP methyl ester carboxylesterase
MAEQTAQANGIEIAYDTFGHPEDPTLLLVMGLGMQMTAWDPEFCGLLAERGLHVVRFDNRDIGLSSKIAGGPKPNPLAAMVGLEGSASYRLADMADDSFGLLDELGVSSAHVAGVSLGGMIAQTMAIRRPDRVASLCSIMSTTGNRRVGIPRLGAFMALMKRAPNEREAYVQWGLGVFRAIGSPGYPFDERQFRERAEAAFDRSHGNPAGVARQLVASVLDDRTEELRKLRLPTLVIHGMDDPLIPVRAGRATARAIPGSKLVEFPGMGHDLPPALWPQLVEEIAGNAARAVPPTPRPEQVAG